MLGSILSFGGKLIDAIFPNKTERDKAKQALAMAQIQNEAALQQLAVEAERELVKARASVVVAEAKGESWLQRCWRPIIMLVFAGLIVAHWFGFTAPNLSESEILSVFRIISIGIGGYMVGRTAEKGIERWKKPEVQREKRKMREAGL